MCINTRGLVLLCVCVYVNTDGVIRAAALGGLPIERVFMVNV